MCAKPLIFWHEDKFRCIFCSAIPGVVSFFKKLLSPVTSVYKKSKQGLGSVKSLLTPNRKTAIKDEGETAKVSLGQVQHLELSQSLNKSGTCTPLHEVVLVFVTTFARSYLVLPVRYRMKSMMRLAERSTGLPQSCVKNHAARTVL